MRKLLCSMFAVLFLAGCSSTFAYNNMDWLLYWYLDDFIELDKKQKETFDVQLTEWLAWHRKEELRHYQEHLRNLQETVQQGPLSKDQVLEQLEMGSRHWLRFRNHISPDLTRLAVHLTDEQVEHLFEVLEEDNSNDEEDFNKQTDEQKAEARIDDIEGQVKEYIGKLTKQQKGIVAQYSPQFRSNMRDWLTYRRAIQADARTLMLNERQSPDFPDKLLAIMLDPDAYRSEEYQQNRAFNRDLNAQLIADISGTLTAKQKKRLNRKLSGWIEDLEDLIND